MEITFTKLLDQNLEIIKDISNNPIVWEFYPTLVCTSSREYEIIADIENYSDEKTIYMEVLELDSNITNCILLIDNENKEGRVIFALLDHDSNIKEVYAADIDDEITETMNTYVKEIQEYNDDEDNDEEVDDLERIGFINADGTYIQNEISSFDDDYSIHDNPYYNDALDLDQQSPDFWENL